MATFGLIIQAITLALKFPESLRSLIKLLSKSPAEKAQEIDSEVSAWLNESAASERPKWEE